MMIDIHPEEHFQKEMEEMSVKGSRLMKETYAPRFLVVEDDASIQPVWERIIRTIDPQAIIRWSRTGEGAEFLIEQQRKRHGVFDFIVADVMLAGKMTGVDLWRKHPESESLFLFVSALSQKKFNEMVGKDRDRFPFLVNKPIDPIECIESIRAMFAYRHAFLGKNGRPS